MKIEFEVILCLLHRYEGPPLKQFTKRSSEVRKLLNGLPIKCLILILKVLKSACVWWKKF